MNVDELVNSSRAILSITLAGLFGLLGFLIGGLAILTGTLGNKVIKHINENRTIKNLISIIFNFYFAGAIAGLTIVLSLLAYLITYVNLPLNYVFFIVITLVVTHLTYFSLIYSVMLLGTCIRLFILGYKFYADSAED